MASRIYFLRSKGGIIHADIRPIALGITSTVMHLKKSGGNMTPAGDSGKDATGTIPSTSLGKSGELRNTVLVVTTVVNLTAVDKKLWDKAFEEVRISYLLSGGIDGDQIFNVDNDDKMRLMENKIIVVTKAIKFEINEND